VLKSAASGSTEATPDSAGRTRRLERAGAGTIEMVERLAEEMEANEKR